MAIYLDPDRDTFTEVVAVTKEARKVSASTAFTMALLQFRLLRRQRSPDTHEDVTNCLAVASNHIDVGARLEARTYLHKFNLDWPH
jgi:hypothetical protein